MEHLFSNYSTPDACPVVFSNVKKQMNHQEACIDAIPVGTSLVVAVYWYPTFCAEIHWLDDLLNISMCGNALAL